MPFTDPGKEIAIIGCIACETFHTLPSFPPPEVFSIEINRLIYQTALGLVERNEPVCIESVNDRLKLTGNYAEIAKALHPVSWEAWSQNCDTSIAFSKLTQEHCIDALTACYHEREAHHIAGQLHSGTIDFAKAFKMMGELQCLIHGSNGDAEWESIRGQRRFDISRLHDKPVAILSLDGQTISTSGNLTSIFAQAKAGKSAVIGAILGCVISDGGIGDFLGWSACLNLEQAAVIHIDTEQSPYDHEQIVVTALKRAGLEDTPSWLHSYCLTDIPVKDRLKAIEQELARCLKEHKKVLALLLDGLGDFILDVNNAEESNNVVAHLHELAIRFEMVVIQVLHENPGADPNATNKMRGHLGSQMERKSESNVRLVKDKNDVTTQYTSKSRHASIPESKGPKFAYDPIKGMHASVDPDALPQATADDREVVGEMFNGVIGGLSWTECHEAIQRVEGIKRDGARKRFKKYVALGLITKSSTDSSRYVVR